MYSIFLIITITISGYLQKFFCTNGKNPKTLSKKQILIEFSKSSCSPIIIVPGIMSTKLTIEIDCKDFRKHNPITFSACGWNNCKKNFWEFWKSVPKKEYNIWLPKINSPLTILNLDEKTNICWANFLKQKIDINKPIEKNPIFNKGYKIRVFGNTENTKKRFNCGEGAISDILNLPLNIQTSDTRCFKEMIQKFKMMGYVSGLTLQSLPYNFFKSYRNSEIEVFFFDNLKRLFDFTRKKVVVIGHSLGNMHIYYNLKQLEQGVKDKFIKNWIAIAPPFLGSLLVNKNFLGGDDSLIIVKDIVGLHFKAASIASNILGGYELRAKDPFSLYKNEKWFQDIKKRSLYEEGKVDYRNSGFDFLPKIEDNCSNFENYSDCKMGLYDISKNFTFQILNKNYTLENDYLLFSKWNLTENSEVFYNITKDKELEELKNPGVPLITMILRSGKTIKQLIYNYNITEYTKKDLYAEPNEIIYGNGDDTVPSYSSLIPVLKWSKEFEKKNSKKAKKKSEDKKQKYSNSKKKEFSKEEEFDPKPVKIIDLCSSYKEKYTVYDTVDNNKEFEITKNEFFGIYCDCMESKSTKDCGHSRMVHDSYVLKLLRNCVVTNEFSWSEEFERYVFSLKDEFLDFVTDVCPQVRF